MAIARRHQLVLELALIALIALLAALAVSTGVQIAVDDVPAARAAEHPAAPPAPAPLADYAVIAARDIFNPHTGGTGRAGRLHLWGVALDGAEARAVIEDVTTHRQDLYRVGDRIGEARVTAIEWDRVTIAGTDGDEVLELAPPAAGGSAEPSVHDDVPPATEASSETIRRTGENAWMVDRREITGAADGMSGLMTQLRAVAEVRDGRPSGFRLFQIRDDSLFARLGLRDGDVVQRVNGATVAEPAALLGFLQRLRTEPRVAVDIVRGDSPRTLVYDLR
jgi:type II secretion system protein C